MIKTLLLVTGALALLVLPSVAAATNPPTETQKAEFHATCMKIAHNDVLCTCKANAAMTLIDERFMAIVISAMEGKTPPVEETRPYAIYIGQSNKICGPGY